MNENNNTQSKSSDELSDKYIIMYYYFDDLGNKIWTSNELLAYKRSEKYNSDIYSVKIPINNITI